ncbi:MAG: radical SAM protein [bacterium]
MKVTFVQSECESLSIAQISSLLKKHGHEVELAFDPRVFDSTEIRSKGLSKLFNIEKELIDAVVNSKPDIVAFSVFTYNYQWSLRIAQRIKEKENIPIIFGGVHATVVPEKVISERCVDIVCVGEGEEAILELLENMHKPSMYNIRNLWFRRNGEIIKNPLRPLIQNLDGLPFPDRELFYTKEPYLKKHYFLLTGRGCPFACTYCATSAIKSTYKGLGCYLRLRSVENVIAELKWAKNKFHPQTIAFVDDVFTTNINWIKEFTEAYRREINIPFDCGVHPNMINHEMLRILQNSGCRFFGIGVQSVSEHTRIQVLKRAGSNQKIVEFAKACHDLNMKYSVDHIFNFPAEGINEQEEALRFYNSIRPTVINTFWLTYYPKTEIITIAKNAGLIDDTTEELINLGKASTSLMVGIGGEYSFDKKVRYRNYAFLFMLLTLLPQKWMQRIIDNNWLRKLEPPFIVNIIIKTFVRIKIGRFRDFYGLLEMLIYRITHNLKVKILKRYKLSK